MYARDAIIVGGGIAGAASALELARHGARVLVIERTREPQLKVCGEFLSPEAHDLLAYLGLDLATLGASAISTLRMEAGSRAATAALPFEAAGLSRSRLDEALLAAARREGAEILRGASVSRLTPEDSGVGVRCSDGRLFHAGAAVLATGKHDLRGYGRSRGALTAFKMSFELTPAGRRLLRGIVHLRLYSGGYLGACLVEGEAATLCWLADAELMKSSRGRWTAQLTHIAQGSPFLGDLLQGARPRSERPAAISAIPFGYMRRTSIAPQVFPVGDQLAVIPSFTGDGTCLAISSGLAAARTILDGGDAGALQKTSIRNLKRQFRTAAAIGLAFRSDATRHATVATMACLPGLATRLAQSTRLAPEFLSRGRGVAESKARKTAV